MAKSMYDGILLIAMWPKGARHFLNEPLGAVPLSRTAIPIHRCDVREQRALTVVGYV